MSGTKGRSGGARQGAGGARAGAGGPKHPIPLIDVPTSSDPLIFLLAVMNDGKADVRLRIDAAKALMPYTHSRRGDAGKKGEAKKSAEAASNGKFKASAPPLKLVPDLTGSN